MHDRQKRRVATAVVTSTLLHGTVQQALHCTSAGTCRALVSFRTAVHVDFRCAFCCYHKSSIKVSITDVAAWWRHRWRAKWPMRLGFFMVHGAWTGDCNAFLLRKCRKHFVTTSLTHTAFINHIRGNSGFRLVSEGTSNTWTLVFRDQSNDGQAVPLCQIICAERPIARWTVAGETVSGQSQSVL